MAQQKYNDASGQWEDDPNAQVDAQPGPAANAGAAEAPGFAPGPTAQSAPAQAPFDRTAFRDAWMGSTGSMDDFLKQNQQFAPYVQSRNGSKDVYNVNNDEVFDLVGDIGGANQHNWTGMGFNAQGKADAPAAPSSFAAPQAPTGNTAQMPAGSAPITMAGGTTAAPALDGKGYQDQLRQKLMEQMGILGQPVSENDPTIAAQTTAYRNERTRGAERERAALAERAAANGLLNGGQSSGAFDSELQGIQENASTDTAGFQAQAMGKEVEARRGHLAQLLSMAVQTGDAESARALQMQMKQMDDALAKLQMQQQGSQFQQQLGQQGAQFNANLGQQASQFNDNFGFNQYQYANDDAYKKALLAAMGGG